MVVPIHTTEAQIPLEQGESLPGSLGIRGLFGYSNDRSPIRLRKMSTVNEFVYSQHFTLRRFDDVFGKSMSTHYISQYVTPTLKTMGKTMLANKAIKL